MIGVKNVHNFNTTLSFEKICDRCLSPIPFPLQDDDGDDDEANNDDRTEDADYEGSDHDTIENTNINHVTNENANNADHIYLQDTLPHHSCKLRSTLHFLFICVCTII